MAVRRSSAGAAALVAAAAVFLVASSCTRSPSPVALDRDMVVVPAGWFTMGREDGPSDERPARRIFLDAYSIDRTEVTNLQYRRFVLATGRDTPRYWSGRSFPAGAALEPVVGVGWEDAHAYCTWVGERLPTEAEWEKACRSSDGRAYPWGETWDPSVANVATELVADLDEAWEPLARPRPFVPWGPRRVGTCSADVSPLGVRDLAGNVAEWVQDWYSWGGYENWAERNPVGTGPPWNHSIRGGAWLGLEAPSLRTADLGRCSTRNSSHSYDDPRVGFRCARSL